jgi:DNA-directed RNA polymerase specialized sigma24 family protein
MRTTVGVLLRHLRDRPERSEVPPKAGATEDGPSAPRSLGQGGPAPVLLEEAIGRLPVDSRFAFVLYHVEGLSHEKIAAMLGWTLGSAKTALAKARFELRELPLNPSRLAPLDEQARPSKTG